MTVRTADSGRRRAQRSGIKEEPQAGDSRGAEYGVVLSPDVPLSSKTICDQINLKLIKYCIKIRICDHKRFVIEPTFDQVAA